MALNGEYRFAPHYLLNFAKKVVEFDGVFQVFCRIIAEWPQVLGRLGQRIVGNGTLGVSGVGRQRED